MCVVHVYMHIVCLQIFTGLYFREFRKSMGDCENEYAYGTGMLLQAAIREIKIAKIVRCGGFAKYTSRENLLTCGRFCI